jgi:triacylglycerol lipase
MNLVLMHGILGFGPVRPPIPEYFNKVEPFLRERFHAKVCVTAVPPLGSIKLRAEHAAVQIAQALSAATLDAAAPIHLIAHSMGGLDARYLLSNDLAGLRGRIRTLACVGTPHLGSPVATLANKLDLSQPLAALISPHAPVIAHIREMVDAVADLTEASAASFNRDNPDVANVAYLNVAGTGRSGGRQTSAFFAPTFHYLVFRGHAHSDGMVPLASAGRGQAPTFTWPYDHADLIGHDLDGPLQDSARTDHLGKYEELVQRFPR